MAFVQAFQNLVPSILRGSVALTVAGVCALDKDDRRALGAELKSLVTHRREGWWGKTAVTLCVAAVGCLPDAVAAAHLLGRRSVRLDEAALKPVLTVARVHDVTWLADLAHRLDHAHEGPERPGRWGFLAGLVRATGAAPPTGDNFVAGWVDDLARPGAVPPLGDDTAPIAGRKLEPLVDRLRADPFLPTLLPRLFEVDTLGSRMLFRDPGLAQGHAFPAAIAQLCDEKVVDRVTVLDATLDRLVRGDRPGALRTFLVLHDALAPTTDEIAARSGTYVRLLTEAPLPVATMAQKALRRSGVLELDALLEASRVVLRRPSKILVRSQLTWLSRLTVPWDERIAGVVAVATCHPAPDVRHRAVTLLDKIGVAPVAA
ncbi:hypothetical protein [Actinoplanes sp. N902-109]|uniref:hypothetical protein n=1 Tax=Actinoplanes sp. (strain N902-109) TaxID=649831 RepID=UPI0003295982|nr:hypothetical protein [Actinoplanes sp. N902-109]AGL14654.1 hypothetical protein L083_1144 [Actinoplanes sp. N902-109]